MGRAWRRVGGASPDGGARPNTGPKMNRLLLLVAASSMAGAPAASEAPALPVIHADYVTEGDAGADSVREVRLLVDGADVTAMSTVTPLRVAYQPKTPLPAGQHAAKVVVTDALGRTWTKEWSFDVAKPAAPKIDHVWSPELLVELEQAPRRTRVAVLALAGWTQPGAEVVVRRSGADVARAIASDSGRFRASVDLSTGDNALAVAARRLDTGDEGPELALRVERVASRSEAAEDDDVKQPPTWRHPGMVTGSRAVLADSSLDRLGSFRLRDLPRAPDEPATIPREPREHAGDHGDRWALEGDHAPWTPPDGTAPSGEVVITKPADGEALRPGHVTVLGTAPSGWTVVVLVDGGRGGDDVANPAGHFTVPRVELGAGDHELVAVASHDGDELRSEPVRVRVEGSRVMALGAALAVTSPARGSGLARGGVQRVAGTAWDGAEIEVEVNGRVVAREIARHDGGFDVDVPLEGGLNVVSVEASSDDGSRVLRSREYAITSSARTSAAPPTRAEGPVRAPVERPRVPGRADRVPAAMPRAGAAP